MLLSELITTLQTLKKEHGNIEVVASRVFDYDRYVQETKSTDFSQDDIRFATNVCVIPSIREAHCVSSAVIIGNPITEF